MNQRMRQLIFVLLTTLNLYGANSVRLATNTGFDITGVPPAEGDFRIEFRIHNHGVPASDTFLFYFGWTGFAVIVNSNNVLRLEPFRDGLSGGCSIALAGRNDMFFRIQRSATNMKVSCEIWNSDGSGYEVDEARITSLGTTNNFNGTLSSGNGGDWGFMRVVQGVVPIGDTPPLEVSPANLLQEWRFESNLNDSSGGGKHMTVSTGTHTFTASPQLLPAATIRTKNAPSWSLWAALRAGRENQLDGSRSVSLANGSGLTYFWQQVSGPSQIIWSSRTVAQPTIQGLVFGTYTVLLRVTDQQGLSSSRQLTFGAVAVDQNDVVVYPNETLQKILGPTVRFGADIWSWGDNRHQALSDFFGGLLDTDPNYAAYWENVAPGTISVSNGSTTVTGVGTSFLTTFRCDGSNSDYIVIRYQRIGGILATGAYPIASCANNTTLTLKNAVNGSAAGSGREYAAVPPENSGDYWLEWNNYYDNVLAHYVMYYRSGNEKYRDYARRLADRFWASPSIAGENISLAPRRRSLVGMVLRALDGRPELWPSLREVIESNYNASYVGDIRTSAAPGDLREDGYRMNEVALGVIADPDPVKQSAHLAALNAGITNKWVPAKQPGGEFVNTLFPNGPTVQVTSGSRTITWVSGTQFSAPQCGTVGVSGTLMAVNGSKVVTAGAGTSFNVGMVGRMIEISATQNGVPHQVLSLIESYQSPTQITLRSVYDGNTVVSNEFKQYNSSLPWLSLWSGSTVDPRVYTCSFVSPTQLTLDRPYVGSSGTKTLGQNNLMGVGIQPFMLGVVTNAFRLVYEATNSEQARSITTDGAAWLVSKGYWPERKGIYYGRLFVGCEPDPIRVDYCEGGGSEPGINRAFSGEVLGGMAAAYLWNPSPQLANAIDNLYSGNFGKLGGPTSEDGIYNGGLDDGNFVISGKRAKDFGFVFGFGSAWRWPAARLGPTQGPILSDVPISFKIDDLPGTTIVAVRVRAPNGTQNDFGCTESPCTLTLDRRMGTYIYKLIFLGSAGQILGESDSMLLRLD